MTAAIEGTAEELDTPTPPAADIGTAVVRRERRSEVIRPLAADQLVESFKDYQRLLPQLLSAEDYQPVDGKKFVKKSGWRKIATAFDLDVQIIRSTVDRDDQGHPLRAEVWARAIAPSGRSMDGDGYCSVDESRFNSPKSRGKLENDLRATATTRAMNRAISGLVGMGEVSAEEVDAGGQPAAGPQFGPPVNDRGLRAASAALTALCGDNEEAARERWDAITKKAGGYMPRIVALALVAAAGPLEPSA